MQNSRLNPYVQFNGNTREAMDFYTSVFGGTLTKSTYKEGGMSKNQIEDNQIMHSMLETPNGMILMAADVPDGMDFVQGTQISISLSGDNDSELTEYYEKLSSEGTIQEPLKQAPWGDKFGMCIDKFGVRWMINIAGERRAI